MNLLSANSLQKNKLNLITASLVLSLVALGLSYLIVVDLKTALIITTSLALLFIFYKRTDIALFLTILSIVAGQLIKIPLGESGGTGIIISDVLVPVLVILWLIKKLKNKEIIFKKTRVTPPLLIFLVIALSSYIGGIWLLESRGQAIVSLLYLARLISYSFLFFVGLDVFQKEKNVQNFKKILLVTFFSVAILGLLQLKFFPKLITWSTEGGWDPHIRRLFSTFLDPNFAGAFLVIGTIIALALLFYTKSFEGRLILLVLVAISFYALILTYSRSSHLFFAVSFVVLALIRSRKLLLLGIILAILLGAQYPRAIDRIKNITNFEEIDESAELRLTSWKRGLTIYQDYPFFGIGYNTYRYAQIRYDFIETEHKKDLSGAGSDSSLLTILITTGVLGLILYLLFYFFAITQAYKSYKLKLTPQRKAFSLALFSILIGLLFHSLFVNSLLYPFIMIILFTLLALILPTPQSKKAYG